MTQRFWEEHEERTLKKLAQTKTAVEIGVILNRSSRSVSSKAEALSLCMTKHGENHHWSKISDEQVETIHELSEAGHTGVDIWRDHFSQYHKSSIQKILSMQNRKELTARSKRPIL